MHARIPRLGFVVLAALLATIAFAIWVALPVVTLATAGAGAGAADDGDTSTERFAANLQTYTRRFDGRYLFFDPPPPRPEPRPIVREVPDDRPPPPPATYGGPRIVAMFADEVWFADGRRLRAGGEEDGSLRVISLESPWSAKVEWRGVPFTVNFFPRSRLVPTAAPADSSAPSEQEPTSARRDSDVDTDVSIDSPSPPSAQPAVEAPQIESDPGSAPRLETAIAAPPATPETQQQ